VQPAALVRGLRRVALEKGVRIYENTEVRSFTQRATARRSPYDLPRSLACVAPATFPKVK